jgi:hypothetical protein
VAISVYNLNRKIQGKVPLNGEIVLQNIVNKIKEWVNNRRNSTNQSQKDNNNTKPQVEDAEFREKKSEDS